MLVGMGSRNIVLPVSAAQTREVDILGSFRYANTYPTALKLLGSNTLPNIEKLITHRFSLKNTKDAFELLARGHDDEGRIALKVMVEASPVPLR